MIDLSHLNEAGFLGRVAPINCSPWPPHRTATTQIHLSTSNLTGKQLDAIHESDGLVSSYRFQRPPTCAHNRRADLRRA